MNGHFDVGRFFCRNTLQKGAPSLLDDKSMREISEVTASLEVVHESVAGPKVDRDSTLCMSILGLANDDFLCGARCFVAACPADANDFFNVGTLPYGLNGEVEWNARR